MPNAVFSNLYFGLPKFINIIENTVPIVNVNNDELALNTFIIILYFKFLL
jgi:hypothetical protein